MNMKKKLLLLLTLFVGVVSATADNTVSVSTVLIPQGKTGTFSIELTNTDAFASSMEVHITLPEGIAFEGVALSDRFTDNPSLSNSTSGQAVTITTLSGANAAVTGNSGPLLFVTVSADAGLTVGTKLTASVTKMELAKKVGDKHEKWNPEPFDFEIEITDKVVLDENSPIVPNATDEEVDILVKRTIKAGQWSTICLPFDMTEEQVYEAFGDDVQVAEFDEKDWYTYDSEEGTIVVEFIDTDLSEGLACNYPYIIKTSRDISEFEVTAQITPDEDDASLIWTTGKGSKKRTVGTFTGTFHAGTVIPENCLFLSDNKFYYSVGKTKSKAFRAYFWFENVLPDVASSSSRISLFVSDDTATGIREVEVGKTEIVYDLQGRRVKEFGIGNSELKKGLYVKDGRKVIIR